LGRDEEREGAHVHAPRRPNSQGFAGELEQAERLLLLGVRQRIARP
jgi:hypothetical protein